MFSFVVILSPALGASAMVVEPDYSRCGHFHQTMKPEFYGVTMRKKIYTSLEGLQKDVDEWLYYYNHARSHSGKYFYGKIPMQTFQDSKHMALEKSNELMYLQSMTDSRNLYDNITSL